MKKTTACFDFGNTRYKCGIFTGDDFVREIILPDLTIESVNKVLEAVRPEYAVLSSVVHHDPAIEVLLADSTHFHKVSHLSKMPISLPFGKSDSVGADRWAMLMAAMDIYPHRHSLIIGLGSCITYNFLDGLGQFLGGSISPGMQMRFKAMNEHTALLPLVEPNWNFPLIGYDTPTHMLSGVILGMCKEIDGIIDMYKERYDHLRVLMTGGDMSFYLPHLHNTVVADPQLIYKGIFAIGKRNFDNFKA